jgi:hypothetical protein
MSGTKIFQGVHVRLTLEHPGEGVVLVTLGGYDVGELGDVPLKEIERHLDEKQPMELYIDARETKGASIEVSKQWAQWLARHRSCFKSIRMATGSRYVELTADFARRFAGLESIMTIEPDSAAFEAALAESTGRIVRN